VSTAAPAPVLRHGEAVAVGLVFAARLARALGRIDDARVAVHDRILAEAELPGRLPEGVDPGKLVELMARDKKALGDLTFVLDGPRGVEVVRGVPRDTVTRVLCELAS
jgi:5-deoxy-5-amino-3-dehydroquinate synthase